MLRKYAAFVTIIVTFIIISPYRALFFNAEADTKSVKVGLFPMEGFYQTDSNGQYSGYGIEYLKKISEYTGWKYEYVSGSRDECEQMLKNGEIDILGFVCDTKENRDQYAFPSISSGMTYGILASLKDSKYQYGNIKSFNGMKVGFDKECSSSSQLASLCDDNGIGMKYDEYYSNGTLMTALENKMLDAVYINNFGISDNVKVLSEFEKRPVFFVTSKDNTSVLDNLNDALIQIKEADADYDSKLYNKYYPLPSQTYSEFSSDDLDYIRNSSPIKAVFCETGFPFAYSDGKGQYSGIIMDTISLIKEKSGLQIELIKAETYEDLLGKIKNGEADFICAFPNNYELSNQYCLDLSVPYMDFYFNVIVNKKSDLDNPVLALVKGNFFNDYIIKKYPNAKINYLNTSAECFNAVNSREADITFENSYVSGYITGHSSLKNINVQSFTEYNEGVCFAVSHNADDQLNSILNKSINNITNIENDRIISKNIIVPEAKISLDKYVKTNKLVSISVIIMFIVIIFLVILIFIRIRKNYSIKISENKDYDVLTGAKNYHKFLSDAEKMILENPDVKYAIIESNLKNFKYINEMFGYDEGNNVLNYLVQTIDMLLNQNEIFGRVNGDNFAILMSYNYESDLTTRLNVIRNKMIDYDRSIEENYTINLIAGIYCVKRNKENFTVKEMVERANMAQISINSNMDTDFLFYEEQMRLNILKENEIIKNMKAALDNNEFQVYLQPQHYIQKNDMILSAEALVRWIKPDGSIMSPGDFIPIFERNGFIVELDRYVFEQVCKFIKKSIENNTIGINVSIAVNVSRIDLYQRDFTGFYTDMKYFYKIPDNMIELEFTESTVFDDYNTFKKIMHELKKKGFKCSLDDFGAGSSSLNVLKELPVDVLKMDRLFFNSTEDEKRNNSVIASVVAMARGLGMKIIAEGIEDIDQVNFLRKIGCDIVQGYVFSKPMPIEKFSKYVDEFTSYYPAELSDEYSSLGAPFDLNDNINIKLFLSILKFVNAAVFSIDLDSGMFKIVSYGKNKSLYNFTGGDYASYLKNYTKSQVYKDDEGTLYNSCSLQSIISCFYRGDEKIYIEYRAKNEVISDSYEYYSATVMRMYTGRSKQIRALLFIQKAKGCKPDLPAIEPI